MRPTRRALLKHDGRYIVQVNQNGFDGGEVVLSRLSRDPGTHDNSPFPDSETAGSLATRVKVSVVTLVS